MVRLSKNMDYLVKDKIFEKKLENIAKRSLSGPEKEYASKINGMGRKAYFDEYFYGIPLEDQVLEIIPGIDDVKNTKTFKEGYQRGAFLVSVGNVPEEYQNINNNKHR